MNDAAHDREDGRAGARGGADRPEPFGAVLQDGRDTGKRLDVVDDGGLAVQPLLDGVRRPRHGHAPEACDGLGQRGFLPADKGAGPLKHVDVEREWRAQDFPAQQPEFPRLANGLGDDPHGQGIFGAHVNDAAARPDGKAADDHALQDLVRVALQEGPVHVGSGVALVGVADHELLVAGGVAGQAHFRPVGNPAPPRPRSPAAAISSMMAAGRSSRAWASAAYPPSAI